VLVEFDKVVTFHNPDSYKCSHSFAKAFPHLRYAGHSIYNNPVEAGFVWKAEDYCYSPAFDYAGGKGYLDVDLIQ
jgi:hypothetical protein